MTKNGEIYLDETGCVDEAALDQSATAAAIGELTATFAERDMIRSIMLGHQALRDTLNQNAAEKLKSAQADMNMLQSFARDVLPTAHLCSNPYQSEPGWLLKPESFDEANATQSRTVFLPGKHKTVMADIGGVSSELPVYILGVKACEKAQSQLLLVSSRRRRHSFVLNQDGTAWVNHDYVDPPKVYISRVKADGYKKLEDALKRRSFKYLTIAETEVELPPELDAAVRDGWPNAHSNPIKFKKRIFGDGLRVRDIKLLAPEDLVDNYPLRGFDVAERMRDLAIDFDKVDEYQAVVAARNAERVA